MMVYGDASFDAPFDELAGDLRKRWERLRAAPSLDEARMVLIGAGQLEQAVADQLGAEQDGDEARRAWCQELTDSAALVFFGLWQAGEDNLFPLDVDHALAAMGRALESCSLANIPPRVQVPEGFAFYALYPEAYLLAARGWLSDHADDERQSVVVVGVRSIGTTLSALLRAALRAGGWPAQRFTVRPTGHPFARQTFVSSSQLEGAHWALLADEGPGLSGSSLASVAQAVHDAGVERARISFFPGHGGEPGAAASPETRRWWAHTPRYVVPLDELRWAGQSLPESLAQHTGLVCQSSAPVERVEEFGGGLWRPHVYEDQAQWPAIALSFERAKWRVTLSDGTQVLWKFAGLPPWPRPSSARGHFETLLTRSRSGWTPEPLGICAGFLATLWVEGRPLARADATPAFVAHLGRYLAATAEPPLAVAEAEAALARLSEMLVVNAREALGDEAATRAERWAHLARREAKVRPTSSYGDGRLAPHEWLVTAQGRWLKTDSVGHAFDHTLVGQQPLWWAVAGALCEWNLNAHRAAPLWNALREANLEPPPLATWLFYRLAYAAFRLGQCLVCAPMMGPEEAARLRDAARFYQAQLAHLLRKSGAPLPCD